MQSNEAVVVIKDFLHTELYSNQQTAIATAQSWQAGDEDTVSKISNNLAQAQTLIADSMSKPVSDKFPVSVGSALKALAKNTKQAFDSMQDVTAKEFAKLNAFVSIGGGFAIDLINGTIVFDITRLTKQKDDRKSSNQLIEALKSDRENKMFDSFQELMANAGKTYEEIIKYYYQGVEIESSENF